MAKLRITNPQSRDSRRLRASLAEKLSAIATLAFVLEAESRRSRTTRWIAPYCLVRR